MTRRQHRGDRLDRQSGATLRSWRKPDGPTRDRMAENVQVEMGWGRIIFAHTFDDMATVAETLAAEREGQRDLAFYIRDPHVLLALSPQDLFLDPSHTYRLWSHESRPEESRSAAFAVRRLTGADDAEAVSRIYTARHMVAVDPAFLLDAAATRLRTYFVAERPGDGRIIGTVTGVDHVEAFNDPENGSSLWCLAVDPQTTAPGVGEAMVLRLAAHYFARGRAFVDLSVMHDNAEAIALYEKLGFVRVPVFCVKRKNPINEPLFVPPMPESRLNPYARIIVDEARRRGIGVEVIDEEYGYFRLSHGGRTVVCRESLTELTSAIAMSRCDNKRLTHRVLREAGLRVPAQRRADTPDADRAFLERHGAVVVKPARGEQGAGISVDIRDFDELESAVAEARRHGEEVILEEYVTGADLRIIVIDFQVVAAAVRRPPILTGTGRHSLRELIDKYNRRRAAATGGESRLPVDAETERCLRLAGYGLEDSPPAGETIPARKTANLHTGGTIHDVTNQIHPKVAEAARRAASALDVPVTGLDLMVPDISGPDYVIIEANERPGLANHEPQPTAERFVDLLFPQTRTPGRPDA